MEEFLAWMKINASFVLVAIAVFVPATFLAAQRLDVSDMRYMRLTEEMGVAYNEFCRNLYSNRFIVGYQRLAHARRVVYRWRMVFWVFYGLAGLPLFAGISALSIWMWTW